MRLIRDDDPVTEECPCFCHAAGGMDMNPLCSLLHLPYGERDSYIKGHVVNNYTPVCFSLVDTHTEQLSIYSHRHGVFNNLKKTLSSRRNHNRSTCDSNLACSTLCCLPEITI